MSTIPVAPKDATEHKHPVTGFEKMTMREDLRDEEDGSVDLLHLLVIFLAEWKIGLAVAVLTFVAGAVYTYHTPPQFEATAVILPKQSFNESNSLTELFTSKHPADLYTGLLRSRSVTDIVIRDLNLLKPGQSAQALRAALLGSLTVTIGTDGLLRLTVRSTDAKRATNTANAYLTALHTQQETMGLAQSVLNRKFYEEQLEQEKQALNAAEKELEETQQRSGVIDATAQSSAGLGLIVGVRSQITALEVQLAALLPSETEQNPQVMTLRAQIAQLQAQERTLEAGGVTAPGAPTTASRMPASNLEFQRKQSAVTFHEGLLNSLANQYQNARLVEASTVDAFQIVDYAIEPEDKSFPPRKQWLMFAAVFGVLLGSIAIVFVIVKRRVQADADYQRHAMAIRQNFRLRRARV